MWQILPRASGGVSVRATIYLDSDCNLDSHGFQAASGLKTVVSGETMRENSSQTGGVVRSSTASVTEITNEERRTVYEYVVEHGPVRPRRLQEALYPNDRRAVDHHLALLEQNGLLVETDDRVRVTADLNRVAEPITVGLTDFDSPVKFRPATEDDRAELVNAVRSTVGEQPSVETASIVVTGTDDGRSTGVIRRASAQSTWRPSRTRSVGGFTSTRRTERKPLTRRR